MTASYILPQNIYNNIQGLSIIDKFTPAMLSITRHVEIVKALASSTSAYFQDFSHWQYILCQSTQYNSATRANMVQLLTRYLNTTNYTPASDLPNAALHQYKPKKLHESASCHFDARKDDF